MLRRELLAKGPLAMFGLGRPDPRRSPAPRPRQTVPGVGSGSGTVVRARQVIVSGPGGGMYAYSGIPAAGNLVSSEGVAPGTTLDPTGHNVVFQGDTDYSYDIGHTHVLALQKSGGQLTAWLATSQAGPYSQISTLVFLTNGLINVPGNIQFQAQVTATGGTAAAPTLITTDTWQAITSFSNGWTAGADPCQVRLMPDGTAFLELDVKPGTLTSGTVVATLPGGTTYAPAAEKRVWAGTGGGTAAVNAPYFKVTPAGTVQCFSMPTGATEAYTGAPYWLS